MTKRKTPLGLGRREQQIVETVVKLGEASVSDVLSNLVDPPSYSAVRAMLGILVDKKQLRFRRDGKRYLYRPAVEQSKSQKKAIARVVETFFGGSASDAFAAMLDSSASQLTDEEINRMMEMIKKAKKENR